MNTTTPATEYTVSVSCNFDADSPEDALRQMTAWLDEAAYHAVTLTVSPVLQSSTPEQKAEMT